MIDKNKNIVIYSEENNRGLSAKIETGEYSAEYLAEISVDKIASVDIPDGLRLKLYRDESLGGGYLGIEESQKNLTQSGWYNNIIKITVEEYAEDEPLVKNYNYILGTQVFGPSYGFKYNDWTYEAAEEIYKMGSNVLKTFDTAYKKILEDMDFMYIYLWVDSKPVWQTEGGMNEAKKKNIYDYMYEFTKNILNEYNNTGKTFYLGHWKGDWYLLQNYDTVKKSVGDENIRGMTDWLNIRQKAVEDAKADTPHENIYVWGYTEACRTADIENGSERLVNKVLPNAAVDYLSYSSYDIQSFSDYKIAEYIKYMNEMIPEKDGTPNPGKRVFIGEMGFAAYMYNYNQERHNKENIDTFIKFFETGVSQILYWEMYSNEKCENGKDRGWWLIDDKGAKWKLYYSFKAFYCNAKEYVREYIAAEGNPPSVIEFSKWASVFLKTLSPVSCSPQMLTEISSFQILSMDEKPKEWNGTIDNEDYIEGSGCFKTDITLKNSIIALPLVIPETDMTALENNATYIEYKLYINDIKLFNLLAFEISSAGVADKKEYQWNISSTDLRTGWNIVRYNLHDSVPGITGGEPDLNKINFIRWYMLACEAGLQLKFDDLKIVQYNKPVINLIVPSDVPDS